MSPETQQDPLIGMTLGGCRIQSLLGRGGMGTVYRAHHLALDKAVALKLLAAHLETDAEFVERFVREARAAAKVDHANVIHVLNVAEENGQHFIILQYVDGENLEQLLDRSGKLDLLTATRIAREATAGLEALHAQGIVHRDIKPANIMLSRDGAVKITDFGLARNLKAVSSFTTVSGAFMGTPGFIAPEQVDGPAVDARADLYALGVVYYMMLSNDLPFNAINALEMATQRVTLDPIPLEDRVPNVDPKASAIVKRLLQRDPKARFGDATELGAAFDEILKAAAPPPAPARRPETVSRKPETTSRTPPRQEVGEVPEVQVYGHRKASAPPPAPVAAAPDGIPEISAGPKKRVLEQGTPIVPREILSPVPLPSKAPKTRPLRAEDYPSNPALKQETSKRIAVEPPKPEAKPPAPWKHVPPPKRDRNLVGNLLFWLMTLAACAAWFAVGALGAPLRGTDGFLASLPRPFIHFDSGTGMRLGAAGAGVGLLFLAFVVNRKQIRASSYPGPAVMLPIFAAISFYAAGLLTTGQGEGGALVRSAAQGALESLTHPVNLALLALWGLIMGLLFGIAGQEDFDHSAGSVLVMLALGASIGFAAGGDIPGVVARIKDSPKVFLIPGAAILVAMLGLFLAFPNRAGTGRKGMGVLVLLGALALAYYGGLPGRHPKALGAPFAGFFPALGHHGVALVLGAMLLSWAAWVLHRMSTMTFGRGR